jgi:hypothetical protein
MRFDDLEEKQETELIGVERELREEEGALIQLVWRIEAKRRLSY